VTTLRAAVMEANSLAGPQTIVFAGWHLLFVHRGCDEDAASSGDLDILGETTIVGAVRIEPFSTPLALTE